MAVSWPDTLLSDIVLVMGMTINCLSGNFYFSEVLAPAEVDIYFEQLIAAVRIR
jgi:hypothetical protein